MLSEGEQRVVALAYFLAEARMDPGSVPLVIDDPVCSLDHRSSRRIAARLAELAKDRQVIVFTHSISFFIEMENEVTISRAPLHRQFISRGASGPGYCDGVSMPWEKLDLGSRIAHLNAQVKRLQVEYDSNPDSASYRQGAGDLCSRLRAGWERAVEEVVLRKVVERYGNEVMTRSLAGVVFDNADFKTVTDAMTSVVCRRFRTLLLARIAGFHGKSCRGLCRELRAHHTRGLLF